jgi:hypothetical protein
LQDRSARHALGMELGDHLPRGFDGGHRLRRWGQFQRPGDSRLQHFHAGSGLIEQTLHRGPAPIPANGPTVQARRPLHGTQVRGGLQIPS